MENYLYICYIPLTMTNKYTTIRITKELRELLSSIGKKNETYEQIIYRLIKEAGYGDKVE